MPYCTVCQEPAREIIRLKFSRRMDGSIPNEERVSIYLPPWGNSLEVAVCSEQCKKKLRAEMALTREED